MDYMELVKKSVSNAWNYRFLWLFGFFVSVTDGFGGGHWWTDKLDRSESYGRFGEFGDLYFDPALLVLLAIAAFSLWIIFWVMGVISEGSLIHGISRKELNLKVSFADCWSAGLGKFLRLLGIMLSALLLVVAVLFGLALIVIPSYFAHIGLGIAMTLLALLVLVPIIIIIVCVEGWAIRFAVLNDERWLAAIGKGWQLFRDNIGKTLAVAFLSLFTQLVLWCILVIGMVISLIPRLSDSALASAIVSSEENSDGIVTPITDSGDKAFTARLAVSAESIPPDSPMTTFSNPFFAV